MTNIIQLQEQDDELRRLCDKKFTSYIIIGVDKDDVETFCSKGKRGDLLWLAEIYKQYLLGDET